MFSLREKWIRKRHWAKRTRKFGPQRELVDAQAEFCPECRNSRESFNESSQELYATVIAQEFRQRLLRGGARAGFLRYSAGQFPTRAKLQRPGYRPPH